VEDQTKVIVTSLINDLHMDKQIDSETVFESEQACVHIVNSYWFN